MACIGEENGLRAVGFLHADACLFQLPLYLFLRGYVVDGEQQVRLALEFEVTAADRDLEFSRLGVRVRGVERHRGFDFRKAFAFPESFLSGIADRAIHAECVLTALPGVLAVFAAQQVARFWHLQGLRCFGQGVEVCHQHVELSVDQQHISVDFFEDEFPESAFVRNLPSQGMQPIPQPEDDA